MRTRLFPESTTNTRPVPSTAMPQGVRNVSAEDVLAELEAETEDEDNELHE